MIELFLSIASFSLSVGGLAAVFVVKNDNRRKIVFSVFASALIVTSGTALFTFYQHEKRIHRVQEEIINVLSSEALTFEDLYQNIFPPVSHELLREALYDGIEKKLIGYRPIRLQSNGKIISVKLFFPRKEK
jgi:hypothetical protein